MVRVLHHSRDGIISFSGIANPKFLLTNRKGEFLFLSSEYNSSRFQGSYFLKQKGRDDWQLFKIIDDLRLVNEECIELRNNFSSFERCYRNAVERFWFTDYGLIYEAERFVGFTQLLLDMREIYDFDDQGRTYRIYPKDDLLIVEYIKYKGNELKEEDYRLFLAIKGIKEYYKTDEWLKWFYESDKKRDSAPGELYIYSALRVAVNYITRLCFAWSDNLDEAVGKANRLHRNARQLIDRSKKDYAVTGKIKDKNLRAAVKCATASANSLAMEIHWMKGIYAGLPWFFQFWARDELISLKPFIMQRQYDFAKAILMAQLGNIAASGNIKNRIPPSDLESADSIGWLAVRLGELFGELRRAKLLNKHFSRKTLLYIKARFERSIACLLRQGTKNGFATNKALATWMDTSGQGRDDVRDDARIEIQALRLRIYAFMQELCSMTKSGGAEKYRNLEEGLRKRVKVGFFKGNMLADGLNDFTVRPNIFIAHYVYPKLLTKVEWAAVFEAGLKKLWCSWGGLATISRDSPLYQPHCTGEGNASYHRGDSWFFVNHLAAISMLRVNRQKFMPYVKKIIEASTADILKAGVIGHMSELSSAERQQPEGSPVQLWSAATFLELINEFIK